MNDNPFKITYTLKTRIVTDPPNVPPGTYVEQFCYCGDHLMWHEYLGPIEGNVAAIKVQDSLKDHFNNTILMISDNLKRYQVVDKRHAPESEGDDE